MFDDTDGMQKYLEEKYGKEFVVENYRIEGAALGIEGDPVADAWPTDNSSLIFKVWDRGNYRKAQRAYSDDYALLYWSDQGEKLLRQALEGKLSDLESVRFYVSGGLQLNFTSRDSYPFSASIPDIREVLKSHSHMINLDVAVRRAVTSVDTPEPSAPRLNEAYVAMNEARQLGITTGKISYVYRDKNFNNTSKDGFQLYQHIIQVPGDKLSGINSSEQLKEYYELINNTNR